MKIRVYNIRWDTDGYDILLPDEVLLNDVSQEEIDQPSGLADILSDRFGWCVETLDFEILK